MDAFIAFVRYLTPTIERWNGRDDTIVVFLLTTFLVLDTGGLALLVHQLLREPTALEVEGCFPLAM